MLKKTVISLKNAARTVKRTGKAILPLQVKTGLQRRLKGLKPRQLPADLRRQLLDKRIHKVNLCCGTVLLPDFINVDIDPRADLVVDLERDLLPFPDNSVEILVCISAINYFTRQRAQDIITDVFRVMKPGGVVRFAVQDLMVFAEKLVSRYREYYDQTLPDGSDRFPGDTIADKFNHFFSGFPTREGKHCCYVYDFETLNCMFRRAGFLIVERRNYKESRIDNIAMIDNRPDQMFFLEAIKVDGPAEFARARSLWVSGQKEEAWALMLGALHSGWWDHGAVAWMLDVMSDRTDGDVLLMIDRFERMTRDRQSFVEQRKKISQRRPDMSGEKSAKLALNALSLRPGDARSDRDHLDGCMQWLRHAHAQSRDGGVPAMYDALHRRWLNSYPETTGYIIPTFLAYGTLTGDPAVLETARIMGDWEIRIQLPNGGVGEAVGVYAAHPRVFNTGQVMLGWLALYRWTKDEKYLKSLQRAADFLILNLESDGAWIKNTFQVAKSYHSRVAWALLELYRTTGDAQYRNAARRATVWVMRQALDNGWFANNGFSNRYASTHLIAYVYVGLMKIYQLQEKGFPNDDIYRMLVTAACRLVELYRKKEVPMGFRDGYDEKWNGHGTFSCLTGNVQIAYFLSEFGRIAGQTAWREVSDSIVAETKKKQVMGRNLDENLTGGLFGCDPIDGSYGPYQMPNWGVKFFADTLLSHVMPDKNQTLIG